jgi:hypothetical protein
MKNAAAGANHTLPSRSAQDSLIQIPLKDARELFGPFDIERTPLADMEAALRRMLASIWCHAGRSPLEAFLGIRGSWNVVDASVDEDRIYLRVAI